MCENDKFGLIIEIYASIATFWLNYSCISAFMTMWNFTVRMPRVFLFSAHISDANFSASSTSGYSTTYVLDLVLPKYKVGVGNLRTEYKYSRHSHSAHLVSLLYTVHSTIRTLHTVYWYCVHWQYSVVSRQGAHSDVRGVGSELYWLYSTDYSVTYSLYKVQSRSRITVP